MAFLQQLIDDGNEQIIGILGGKGRNVIINQIASEAGLQKKRVVITHIEGDILPPSGHIVLEKNEKELLSRIEREFNKNPIIYAGTAVNDHFISAVSEQFIDSLQKSSVADLVLLILGDGGSKSILVPKEISGIAGLSYLDRLIYCFQFDLIDQPISQEIVRNPENFLKKFPRYQEEKNVLPELIVDYLTDKKNGAFRLFKQKWPAVLILTDINNILLENRSIGLARDLAARGIEHIFQANLKENLVKRVSAK